MSGQNEGREPERYSQETAARMERQKLEDASRAKRLLTETAERQGRTEREALARADRQISSSILLKFRVNRHTLPRFLFSMKGYACPVSANSLPPPPSCCLPP